MPTRDGTHQVMAVMDILLALVGVEGIVDIHRVAPSSLDDEHGFVWLAAQMVALSLINQHGGVAFEVELALRVLPDHLAVEELPLLLFLLSLDFRLRLAVEQLLGWHQRCASVHCGVARGRHEAVEFVYELLVVVAFNGVFNQSQGQTGGHHVALDEEEAFLHRPVTEVAM